LLLAAAVCSAIAQSARDTAVEMEAIVSDTVPRISLLWSTSSYAVSSQSLYRRQKGASDWGVATSLANATTNYADSNAVAGVSYEYKIQRTVATIGDTFGCLNAGVNLPLVASRGRILVVVDDTMSTPLATELEQYQHDLACDGWTVVRTNVARETISPATTGTNVGPARLAEVQGVRAAIQTLYNQDPSNTTALVLIGRVPLPYSGMLYPDGHTDHKGAWPTDSYYGDVNGTWTDTSTDTSSSQPSDPRNQNVPGDGKFDPSTLPDDVELQVGRIDLSAMTLFPNSSTSETELLRRYLQRNHDYRIASGSFADIPRRALIDDNFGYFVGEAFAAVGWRAGPALFGRQPGSVDVTDWFDTMQTNRYLLAYGCGGGSWMSAGGIGTSSDFGSKTNLAVFNILFGSYFGDWDTPNGFLRAPLAGTEGSFSLTSCWGSRPNWVLCHLAMGETIGYAARVTENNTYSNWKPPGWGPRHIHVQLLGDPTLRLHTVAPAGQMRASSGNDTVMLAWSASADTNVIGYHVSRGAGALGPFTPLTPAVVGGTNYTDSSGASGQTHVYLVRPVKRETSGSGTYTNMGIGVQIAITVNAGSTSTPANPTALTCVLGVSNSYALTWQDNATNELGFLLERRAGTTGVWTQVLSPGADATNITDTTTPVGVTPYYRICAYNGAGNSPYSDAAHNTAPAPPPPDGPGTGITREWWDGIGSGSLVSDLTSNTNFPTNPTGTETIAAPAGLFEAPVNRGDQYGTRMRGTFIAPLDGNYTFYIASDDASELWLSPDANPSNKQKIAWVATCTTSREWIKETNQTSAAIALAGGQRYYIEALQKEGSGSDNLAVGVRLPDGTYERPIPCHRLAPWIASNLPPVIAAGQTATGTVGQVFAYSILASNSPTGFVLSGGTLPPGVSLTAPSGLLNGTPTTAGTYTPGFTASNAAGTSAVQTVTVTILPVVTSGSATTDVAVAASQDDAKERTDNHTVKLTSGNLDMTWNDKGYYQLVGIRFTNLPMPTGAVIDNAWIQFTVDTASNVTGTLTIQAQAADNAAAFTTNLNDVSARPRTAASATWNPPDWTVVGAAGVDQRTPSLVAILQEVVSRSGWTQGNAVAMIITGNGQRIAESWDGANAHSNMSLAPVLHVEYSWGGSTIPSNAPHGTPIAWLQSMGFTNDYAAAEEDDPDSDEAKTWQEYVAGTNPTNGLSVFMVSRLVSDPGVTLTWYGTTNNGVATPFSVYRCTNLLLGLWTPVASNLNRDPTGTNLWQDPSPPPDVPAFYRPACMP